MLYLDRLRLLALDHPADVLVYPDEGMTDAAEAVPPLRGARPAHAAGDRPLRARRDRAPGGDRSRVRGRPAARAHPRLREGARAHPRPLGACRRRTRSCSSPAGPTTPSRATTSPRTRRASPLKPPAARGRARRRHVGDRGRAGGDPRGEAADGRGGPRREARSLATRPGRHDHARLLGPGRGRPPRRRTWPSCPRPSIRVRADLGERGFSAVATDGGAAGLRLRAGLVAVAVEDDAGPLHAGRRRAAAAGRGRRRCSWCRSRATS